MYVAGAPAEESKPRRHRYWLLVAAGLAGLLAAAAWWALQGRPAQSTDLGAGGGGETQQTAPGGPLTPEATGESPFGEDWVPVGLGPSNPDETGYTPREMVFPSSVEAAPKNGDASEVLAATGEQVGYWVHPVGFVEPDVFEAPDFDWADYARETFEFGDELVEQAEEGASP